MQAIKINEKNHCDTLFRFFNNKKMVSMMLAPINNKKNNPQTYRPAELLNCEKTDDAYIAGFQSNDGIHNHSNKNIKTSIHFKELDEYKTSIAIRDLRQYCQESERDILSFTEEGNAYVYFSYY